MVQTSLKHQEKPSEYFIYSPLLHIITNRPPCMYVSASTNVTSRVCCARVQRDNLSMEAEQRSSYLPSPWQLACCTLVLAFLYLGAGLGEKELEPELSVFCLHINNRNVNNK